MDFIMDAWPWYVGGPLIALVMFLLYYFGRRFGVSSNLETMCTMGGVGRWIEHFRFDWKAKRWNLVFILGTIIGGFVTVQWLTASEAIALNPQTISDLAAIGVNDAGAQFLPDELFSIESMLSIKGFLILLIGGFLVGFGARYAGGCTSGHAIAGISNLEWPSLLSVIGFFIGGLIITWFIIPLIL